MNSKRFKLACGFVKQINIKAVSYALEGVLDDVLKNKYPDHEKLIPAWGRDGLVGSIKAIPNWNKNPLIVDNLAGAVVGRMTQFHLMDNGIHPMEMDPSQLTTLMALTDEVQAKAVIKVIGEEQYKLYKEKEKQLTNEQKETFAALCQVFAVLSTAEQESGPKPTVH